MGVKTLVIEVVPGSISSEHPQGLVAYDVAQIQAYNKEVALDGISSFFTALLLLYTIWFRAAPEVMKWWMYAIEAPLWIGLFVIGTIRIVNW